MSRHVYVAPTDAEALAEAKDAEMWYQESLRRFLLPERIDRVHPLLQAGFRTMQERFATVSWEQLVAEEVLVAFGSPDTVAERVDEFRRLGVGEMLCWMNFGGLPSGPGSPLHGALRPRGHAAVPLMRTGPHLARVITMPIAFVKAPTVNGFWSSRPSRGASAAPASARYPET